LVQQLFKNAKIIAIKLFKYLVFKAPAGEDSGTWHSTSCPCQQHQWSH